MQIYVQTHEQSDIYTPKKAERQDKKRKSMRGDVSNVKKERMADIQTNREANRPAENKNKRKEQTEIDRSHNSLIIIRRKIILISFKGAVRDFLQPPRCASNCLQHVRSSGQGTKAQSCENHVQHIERLSRVTRCVPAGTKGLCRKLRSFDQHKIRFSEVSTVFLLLLLLLLLFFYFIVVSRCQKKKKERKKKRKKNRALWVGQYIN